jgi:hypothetical protein
MAISENGYWRLVDEYIVYVEDNPPDEGETDPIEASNYFLASGAIASFFRQRPSRVQDAKDVLRWSNHGGRFWKMKGHVQELTRLDKPKLIEEIARQAMIGDVVEGIQARGRIEIEDGLYD